MLSVFALSAGSLKKLEILDLAALPENAVGKVDRKTLAQQVGRTGEVSGMPG